MVWNGRTLKDILRGTDTAGGLQRTVREVTQSKFVNADGYPAHFFEVELRKISRIGNDTLMNPGEIRSYLSQVAPVPFAPSFSFSSQIDAFLDCHGLNATYAIEQNDGFGPIYRPYNDDFQVRHNLSDKFTNLRTFLIESMDGKNAAVGWMLDHSYFGAIPKRSGISGLRFRCGNIQVGSNELAADLFGEPRFNGWCVGEIHVVHDKIQPNGRRDDFEPNVHYQSLLSGLAPYTRAISRTCRDQSIIRNRLRKAHTMISSAGDSLRLLKGSNKSIFLVKAVNFRVAKICNDLRQLSSSKSVLDSEREMLNDRIAALEAQLKRSTSTTGIPKVLKGMHATKRVAYEHVLTLVYEQSPDLQAAHALTSRILQAIKNSKR